MSNLLRFIGTRRFAFALLSAGALLPVTAQETDYQRGVRQLRDSQFQEAFASFAKAGNALDRRAAAWAALALEEGLGIARDPEAAAEWHLLAATGALTPHLPVEIEWLGDDTVRYLVVANRQRITIRADGRLTREFLREMNVLKPGSEGLGTILVPAYTQEVDATGQRITFSDERGNYWSQDAPSPEDRLEFDPKTSIFSFVDDLDRQITFLPGGERTIAAQRGQGFRTDTDSGGRLTDLYPAGATKPSNQFQHRHQPDGTPLLTRFIAPDGGLWVLTPLENGRQRWVLQNTDTGEKIPMEVIIRVNGANSVVYEDGLTRRIETRDGTVVVEKGATQDGSVHVLEKTVSSKENEANVAYLLRTFDRGGVVFQQEMISKAGHFVRGGEGQDFQTAPWREINAKGRAPAAPWAGEFHLDDDGVLIKRGYLTGPDPDRPGETRVKRDPEGRPFVDVDTYLFTGGESEQRYPHGGVIHRNEEGNILWITTPAGEVTRFYYTGQGESKSIGGFREGAHPRRSFDDKVNAFVSRPDAPDPWNSSCLNLTLHRSTGELVREDAETKAKTAFRPDGSRRLESGRNVVELDGAGRITFAQDSPDREFKLTYGSGGNLVRVDLSRPPLLTSVVETNAEAPAESPQTRVLRGTNLAFAGWGEDRYVTFLNPDGHRALLRADGTLEERAGEASAPLTRAELGDGFAIVREGPGATPSEWTAVAREIHHRVSSNWRNPVVYTDMEGRRIERAGKVEIRIHDGGGRLTHATDSEGREYRFEYNPDAPAQLIRVVAPGREWQRVPGSADFRLTDGGDLLISHPYTEGATVRHELIRTREPGRVTIDFDGTMSHIDRLDRLRYRSTVNGDEEYLLYNGTERVTEPKKVAGIEDLKSEVDASVKTVTNRDILVALERTARGRDGKTSTATIMELDAKGWKDDQNVRYESLWGGGTGASWRAVLMDGSGRSIRVIQENGREIIVSYNEDHELISRVVKNGLGEVTAIQDSIGRLTRIERDEAGRIVMVIQGADVIAREKDGRFSASIHPDLKLEADLEITPVGVQIWKGKNGVTRIVRADGSIQVRRPDGTETHDAADRTWRTHRVASPFRDRISEVTHYRNGDLAFVLEDRHYRQAAGCPWVEALGAQRQPVAYERAAAWRLDERLSRRGIQLSSQSSSRNDEIAESTGENRYPLTLGWFELGQDAPAAIAPTVAFITQPRKNQPIVALAPGTDGKIQFQFAAVKEVAPAVLEPADDLDRARLWMRGNLGPAKMKEGVQIIEKAAAKGDIPAMKELAILLMEGRAGVTRNPAEGFAWLEKAATAGDADAQLQVGLALCEGSQNQAKDEAAGLAWLQKAAQQGSRPAKLAFEARQPTKSPGLAGAPPKIPADLLERAQKGDNNAQFMAGLAFEKAGDLDAAKEWFKKAADAGNPAAMFKLKELQK